MLDMLWSVVWIIVIVFEYIILEFGDYFVMGILFGVGYVKCL